MTQLLPIALIGHTLGERHRHLNSLVNDTYQQKVPFESIQGLPEQSAVDRLFKIDLASRYRDVDYIIQNLKDDDMLYVSRALKCIWLLEQQYRVVINPEYLENTLFPEMCTTAVNKTRHWIHLHLKDACRSQEFFQYYFSKNLQLAMKFFWNCSVEYIATEVVNVREAITHQNFKLLCEKCPHAVGVYFDALTDNQILLQDFEKYKNKYYHGIMCLLKVNPSLFFYLTEKFYSERIGPFKSSATLYIMKNHRNRFSSKPELYAAWILDINTLAKCLNSDEIKDLILKLARAKYLRSWFSYTRVEPLIKKLSSEERAAFKQQVFVNKAYGETVENWPYSIPSFPTSQLRYRNSHVFFDGENKYSFNVYPRQLLRKQKRFQINEEPRCFRRMKRSTACIRMKTLLDQLYDRYRFVSFDKTLFELRKQLKAESSSQNREYMMLVLVSKSGGHAECLEQLLQLLVTQHSNEPVHVRAAVLRSLVRRAAAWRLPASVWRMLLGFARGLGLDGAAPEVACWEGLHAVVLRDILAGNECQPAQFLAYMRQFSTFTDYKLNLTEKRRVVEQLPALILSAVAAEPSEVAPYIDNLLRFLDAYHIQADACPGVLPAIITWCHRESSSSERILQKIFDARIGRKLLFRENFAFIKTNASYLNVLRHDARLIAADKFKALAENNLRHDGFLRKLSIYFAEKNGLADCYLAAIYSEIKKNPRVVLARSLTLLCGNTLTKYLEDLDKQPANSVHRRLAAQLRGNAHLCRPRLDLDSFGWRAAGVKAVANKVIVCKTASVDEHVRKLLSWRSTAKLALIIASRSGQEVEIFTSVASIKPSAAIKVGLHYLQSGNKDHDPRLWNTIKPLITQLDLSDTKFKNLLNSLGGVLLIPKSIKAEYCSVIFRALPDSPEKFAFLNTISNHLSELDEEFVQSILLNYINNQLTFETLFSDKRKLVEIQNYRIIAPMLGKFLLLSRSEDAQRHRFEVVGKPFLDRYEVMWEKADDKRRLIGYLNRFIESLKYNTVFFDTSYVSCLPVFEKVLTWIEKVVSSVKYFDMYVKMHLTLLYFKSIRQGIKNEPQIFADKARRDAEGVEIVGIIFGQHLAYEMLILANSFFNSIVLLYAQRISKYFVSLGYDESRDKLMYSVAKGFLEANPDSNSRMLILKGFINRCGPLQKGTRQQVVDLLLKTEDPQIKFFLHNFPH